jgi:hypothetical protein
MYGAYAAGGGAGLTLLRLAVIAAMLALIGWTFHKEQIAAGRLQLLLAFIAVLTYTRTQHIRPQLYSVLLFAALLCAIKAYERRPRAIWCVPVLMALWTNLHGGWILGLGALGLWAGVEIVMPVHRWRDRLELSAVVIVAAAATLINPYGFGLWTFLFDTVGVGRPDIVEWLPMTQVQPGIAAFWLVSCAAAFRAVWRARPDRWSYVPLIAALGLLSFRVNRLDAFFCLSVFVLLGRQLAGTHSRETEVSMPAMIRRRPALAVVAVLIAIAIRWPAVGAIDLSTTTWLPEPQALAWLRAHGARGTMVTYFDWGEYAIWHLGPDVRVSIDGRRETVYSKAVIDRHFALYRDMPNSAAYVRQLNPNLVWLPTRLAAVAALRTSGDWSVGYSGRISTVLVRRASTSTAADALPAQAAGRVFPGP